MNRQSINMERKYTGFEVAVIGMAGRFPQAGNVAEFWSNLRSGRESIVFFSEEELMRLGYEKDLIRRPDFVRTRGSVLDGKEYFDAAFFEYLPAEAEILNPQTRLLHECVWEALEDAAYNPFSYTEPIALYLGASASHWDMFSLFGSVEEVDAFSANHLSSSVFCSTLISYRLNLQGPSCHLHTACSTSLVAIHQACQALLLNSCKIAVAGGMSFSVSPDMGISTKKV